MTCVHTGARVWLDEYDAQGVCDAHLIGGTAVFRISGTRHGGTYDPLTMYKVLRVSDGWFGIDQAYSTLVVPLTQVVMPDREVVDRRWG